MSEHEKAVPTALTGSHNGGSAGAGREAASTPEARSCACMSVALGFVFIYSKCHNLT